MKQGQSPEKVKTTWWKDGLLVGLLILFDMAIHPLSLGPDRLVHDPAVYRLGNPNYLPGDWYTGMAVQSQVYIFYAKLINAYKWLHLPEEFWRQLLYLACLAILYYSLIRIARLFTKNILVVPLLVLLHAFLNTGANQPPWLYGPFIHVDGGVAPRSIGVAFSFLALFYLLRGSLLIPAALLGLATLIHVSNSFIVFTLLMAVWAVYTWLSSKENIKERIGGILRKLLPAVGVYLVMGGWFAFYIALQGGGSELAFSTDKFIWSWVFLRAPYMALTLGTLTAKAIITAKVLIVVAGWLIARKLFTVSRKQWDMLGILGIGTLVYFMLFYLFAFVWPWLPGFQFYSIRVIYFAYFVAFFTLSLLALWVVERISDWTTNRLNISQPSLSAWKFGVSLVIIGLITLGSAHRREFLKPAPKNIQTSVYRLLDYAGYESPAVQAARIAPSSAATFSYVYNHPSPVLAPPTWNRSSYYVPTVVSFKSFGFTESGLVEWYNRINEVTNGEIERIYQMQQTTGRDAPVALDWGKLYQGLTTDQVLALAKKYNTQLFVTYKTTNYPFPVLAEDTEFRLYQLPKN